MKDASSLPRLYEPASNVFDAWGVCQYARTAAWQHCVEAWFTSLGSEKAAVSFSKTAVHGTPKRAIASCFVTYAGLSSGAESLRSMDNRMTWGLRTTGHVLRICHKHSSAPIGFGDMRATLSPTAP